MLEASLFRARRVVYEKYSTDFEVMLEVAKQREKEYRELKAKGFV